MLYSSFFFFLDNFCFSFVFGYGNVQLYADELKQRKDKNYLS